MHIVLVEPEIPGNTGNISRLCAANGFDLHLVKPLGFSIDDKHVKRAGLDYWHLVKLHIHDSFQEVQNQYQGHNFYYCSTKATRVYSAVSYHDEDFIVFGKETAGLPEKLLLDNPDACIRIPMVHKARSLNLSNAVAIVAYEALRQNDFQGLLQHSSYFA